MKKLLVLAIAAVALLAYGCNGCGSQSCGSNAADEAAKADSFSKSVDSMKKLLVLAIAAVLRLPPRRVLCKFLTERTWARSPARIAQVSMSF